MAKSNTTRSAFLAMGVAMAFAAQSRAVPPPDAALLRELPAGSAVEARLDADIDGDRIADVAFVGGDDEARWLVVRMGRAGGAFAPAAAYRGLGHPLGPASLAVKRRVLLVDDLTGGTTATAATYRYRLDPATQRLRLIGLDAERYSRTNSHDSLKASWNLLTGAFETVRGILDDNPSSDGDAAYRYATPERTLRKSNPVYLEDSPDPDALIDAEVVPPDEDRD